MIRMRGTLSPKGQSTSVRLGILNGSASNHVYDILGTDFVFNNETCLLSESDYSMLTIMQYATTKAKTKKQYNELIELIEIYNLRKNLIINILHHMN